MSPHLVPGPGAMAGEYELVLAEWPDGRVITRWAGSRWTPESTMSIRLMEGPGRAFNSYFIGPSVRMSPYGPPVEVGANFYHHAGPNLIPRWAWFIQAAMIDGKQREQFLDGHEDMRATRLGDPGELAEGIEMYALLGERHPAFAPEPVFREWLASVSP